MNEKIKKYLEWKATYAPRASYNYRIWLNRFVEVCGDMPLKNYSVTDYVKFKIWMEDRFSPYCVQFATIVIKNFFGFYKHQGYPCLSPVLIKLPRFLAKSHRAVSEEEYNKILAVIPTNEFRSLRNYVITRMLWDTGVRVSELCDLDLSQFNENKRSTVICTKKNGKQRIIVWSEETHYCLIRYLTLRLELNEVRHGSPLFVGWNKDVGWTLRLTTRTVQRMIMMYVRQAGINEKITPHSFRHGWAHKRRDQNAPLAFIQRGLGHSNPMSTFIYEQYNDNEFVANAEKFLCPEKSTVNKLPCNTAFATLSPVAV